MHCTEHNNQHQPERSGLTQQHFTTSEHHTRDRNMNEFCATNTLSEGQAEHISDLCCQSLPQSSMSLDRCQKGGEKVQRKKETQSRNFGLPSFYMFTFTKAKDKITAVDWSHKDTFLQQQVVTALGVTAAASRAHFYPHQQRFNSCEVQGENP